MKKKKKKKEKMQKKDKKEKNEKNEKNENEKKNGSKKELASPCRWDFSQKGGTPSAPPTGSWTSV